MAMVSLVFLLVALTSDCGGEADCRVHRAVQRTQGIGLGKSSTVSESPHPLSGDSDKQLLSYSLSCLLAQL